MPVSVLGEITFGDARLYRTDVDPTTLGGLDVTIGCIVANGTGIYYKFGAGLTDFKRSLVFDDITSGVVTSALGFTPISLSSLSASSPLSYNNTTGAFSIQVANTSQNGYLSSIDWNTFNGKQAALVSGTNIKTVNGTTLLGSGDLQVGTILGSLAATSGLIPFATGTANTIQGSSTFSYNLTDFVAQPTTSFKFQVGSTATNASIYADSTGVRVGKVSNIGTALVRSFEVYGTGVPLLINSTNSTTYKLAWADAGTDVAYLGGTSGNPLTIYNSSAVAVATFSTAGGNSFINSKLMVGSNSNPTSNLQVTGSFAGSYIAKTANYTATISDYVIDCTTGTFTITLPTAVGIVGRIYIIKNSGAGSITLDTTSSQTIDGSTTKTIAAAAWLQVQSDNANWKIIG